MWPKATNGVNWKVTRGHIFFVALRSRLREAFVIAWVEGGDHMFRLMFIMPIVLAGCGVAQHHPPANLDPPAVEFTNAEGVRRYCTSPHYSESNYRSCRSSLLSDGYREVGPYCSQPEPAGMATNVAVNVLFGGVGGAIAAARMQEAHAAHRTACQQRQAGT